MYTSIRFAIAEGFFFASPSARSPACDCRSFTSAAFYGGVFSICTTAWLTYATPSFAESKHLSLMLAGVTTPF
ncbi:hypothetical protein XSP_001758 [Xanthomonas euroxanthea]|uniref:Uncharacterized protein n=1 Tax=Xanthomonas euroxanthea TaxID=2259622 RepID=A0A8E4MCL1_9XANT|nr:hypothetical protein XSP_001758 [Xanthomonas euroxanthea]